MNVSIKPFLILTSSPQMASLIYPFPRILAVHLKYAPANTSRKKKNSRVAKGVWVFFFFFGANPSHHLPTEMGRYDCNYATGLPRKAQTHHRLIWQLFLFLPVSGYSSSPQWEQKLMLQYAGTTAGEASHIQLHLQRVFIVAGKTGWRAGISMTCTHAGGAKRKYVARHKL